MLTRRGALKFTAASAGLALLAACQPAAQSSSTQSSSAAPAPAPTPQPTVAAPTQAVVALTPTAAASTAAAQTAQPRTGGTLQTAILADVLNLDGHILTGSGRDSFFTAFDHLALYDDQLKPQPALAESWDLAPDLTQIKLNLRQGVQFHTGREFTSDDVKWNLLRVRDPKTNSVGFANQSNWFTSIDTPDKYTVVLKSDQPRPAIFDFFEYLNILDHETMEGPDSRTKVVGTGPFTFVEWAQGDHITMARNANYWQSGRPYVDGIVIKVIKDASAAVATLEAGAADVISTPPLQDFVRLSADPNYLGLINPNSGQFYCQGVNVLNPPLDDKRVRQALNYALDRQRIADRLLMGTSQPESLPWQPASLAYEASKQNFFTFDLDKAKALLAQAGVSNLNIDILPLADFPVLQLMAQVYQGDLASIGVTLNVLQIDSPSWFDQANNRKYNGFYSTSSTFAQLEPVTLFTNGRVLDPNSNNSGFKDDQYQSLINQAAGEPDTAKRKAIYSQLNDFFLDQSFVMPIADNKTRWAARARVHNVLYTLNESFSYADLWLG